MPAFLSRPLPQGLESLTDLALDLRWTWSHSADDLWRMLDKEIWERTENPWVLLQDLSQQRLEELAADAVFCKELKRLSEEREAYLAGPGWYGEAQQQLDIGKVAYFSMEFGLGEALRIYAGGLGILAGDFLKTASDLGVPLFGIGLLYQEGYFRQMLDADGLDDDAPQVTECRCVEKISGAVHGYRYQANIETKRPAANFTPCVIPYHAEAQIPAEAALITWQR